MEHAGQLYSTIRDCGLAFDGLVPETGYAFKVRAVNKDGYSQWAAAAVTTKADPLEFAVKGIVAVTSCPNQGGADVKNLFDFDGKSQWHTLWGQNALPFEMTIDLRSVNRLDRLVYLPREDAGNGTLLKGTVAYGTDRQTWSEPRPFEWTRDAGEKTFSFDGGPEARYLRIAVTDGVGGFGSGRELYVFKVPGTESVLQGDINKDGRIDENDLTSYMNYTGLRRGDGDFDYVSAGDVNRNGLIDAYDISVVATQLDGGVRNSGDKVAGSLLLIPEKATFAAGDEVRVRVSGKGLHYVNALSFALPYDTRDLEFAGIEKAGMKDMVDLTYDRLHTDGRKALYPTFVNRGNNFLLDDGDHDLFVIKFKARRAGKFTLKAQDGLLVDRNLGTVSF